MDMHTYAKGVVLGSAGGQTYAYPPSNEAAPIRDTIGGVANDLDSELQRLQMLHNALERIAEHLDGPVPQLAGADEAKLDHPPHSLLDNMRRKQRAAQVTISRCEAAVSRIANALGV